MWSCRLLLATVALVATAPMPTVRAAEADAPATITLGGSGADAAPADSGVRTAPMIRPHRPVAGDHGPARRPPGFRDGRRMPPPSAGGPQDVDGGGEGRGPFGGDAPAPGPTVPMRRAIGLPPGAGDGPAATPAGEPRPAASAEPAPAIPVEATPAEAADTAPTAEKPAIGGAPGDQGAADAGANGRAAPGDERPGLPALGALTATRERPLFVPGRRGVVAPRPIAALPVPVATAPEERPPPPLTLVLSGVVNGPGVAMAILREADGNTVTRMRTGDERDGWTLEQIDRISVTFRRGEEEAVLTLKPPGQAGADGGRLRTGEP